MLNVLGSEVATESPFVVSVSSSEVPDNDETKALLNLSNEVRALSQMLLSLLGWLSNELSNELIALLITDFSFHLGSMSDSSKSRSLSRNWKKHKK